MAPIKVGIIGLSKPNPDMPLVGAWARIAHLPPLLYYKDLYQITALCNFSVESAQASRDGHGLPKSVKAYGDPTALANDPDVELVVVSVFIGKHYELVKPALEAGKMVYVEAPLAASVAEGEELAALARARGLRTMVGTQGRANAAVVAARKLLSAGEIGRFVSSTLTARWAGYQALEKFPVEAKWGLELEAVGNSLMIGFMHILDVHQQVVGEFADYHALVMNNGGDRQLFDNKGNYVESVKQTAPDHVLMHGKLQSGGVASIAIRPNVKPTAIRTPPMSDKTYFRWIITGTKGELEMTTPNIMWQMAGSSVSLQLTKDGKTQDIDVPREHGEEMALEAENTAAQYVAFAKGDKEQYADFDDALKLAKVMEELREVGRQMLKA